ncbi:MAG: DoxX family protein [Ilumatobacter sp.]
MLSRIVLAAAALMSASAFTYYGLTCMYSTSVRREYLRYGIPGLRVLNGSLMLCGAGGLMLGLLVWPLGMFAAAGLTTMMLLGLLTRVRLGDHPRLMIPAALLAVINGALLLAFPLT